MEHIAMNASDIITINHLGRREGFIAGVIFGVGTVLLIKRNTVVYDEQKQTFRFARKARK